MRIINNKLLVVIIGSLLLFVGIFASVYQYYWKETRRVVPVRWNSAIYGNVTINEPYYIIVPVPLNNTMKPLFIVNDFKLTEGNASINYTETKYGLGLRIEASGDFIIEAEHISTKILDYFAYYTQSVNNVTDKYNVSHLEYYTNHLFWFFGNFSTQNNTIDLKMWIGPAGDKYCNIDTGYVEGTIKNGWQKINGEYSVNVYC